MSGIGIFPGAAKLRPAKPKVHYDMAEIDDLLTRSALNFRDQKEVLADIPKKSAERSLPIYFW